MANTSGPDTQQSTEQAKAIGAMDEKSAPLSLTEFDLAKHNAIVTVRNPATGNHRTFRISTIKSGDLKGRRRISLLTGPDNTRDYQPFALLGEGTYGNVAYVYKKFRGKDGIKTDWEKFAVLLMRPREYAERFGLEFHFSARCRRCGRTLTTPDSVTAGLGPECIKKG